MQRLFLGATFAGAEVRWGRMSIRLSTAEITQLEAALTTLLSPLDFESVAEWRTEVRGRVRTLVRSDTSVSVLPLDGEVAFQSDNSIAFKEYSDRYYALDPTSDACHRVGTEAFIWPTMSPRCEQPSRDAWLHGEFLNDWVRKQRFCQPCGLTVIRSSKELAGIPFEKWRGIAGLWFYWNRDTPSANGERELVILRLLLPAFEAAIHILVRCGRERELVAQALSDLGDGVMLVDEAGRIAYENAAFGRILGADPVGDRIRARCARLGRQLLAGRTRSKSLPDKLGEPLQEQIGTTVATYRLRGALFNHGGLAPMALVTVESAEPTKVLVGRLGQRLHLTPREQAVSYLLAEGYSNAEVARQLGVSIHTARRHVEHVLTKLGVHSRAAVGARLRQPGDGRES